MDRRRSCRLSHNAILKHYLKNDIKNYDAVMICEDDCIFHEPVYDKTLKKNIPEDFDMIFASFRPLVTLKTQYDKWFRIINGWSMACYIVSNKFLNTYIENTNISLKIMTHKRTQGFEHISNIPNEYGGPLGFIKKYKIYLPKILWSTIDVSENIGFSDIEKIKAKRTLSQTVDRIHWYSNRKKMRITII